MSYATYSWLRILMRKYPTIPTEMFNNRIDGKTTRLIDKYIQDLFTNGYIDNIKDHHDTHISNLELFRLIKRRLHSEHNYFIDVIHFNRSLLKIIIS